MKRLLALLLCLVMCVSLIPAAAAEDIEISVAALEHRFPDLEARSSPFRQAVLGH